ncbi:MAG: DUF4197 domain-containing protein [Gammaproteobacteria bacterium]
MIKKATTIQAALLLIAVNSSAQAGWQDFLQGTIDQLSGNEEATQVASSLLSNSEITAGLKEALARGVETAINSLGQTGGFMDDSRVKIPLPGSLQLVERTARNLGQGQYADQFVATMNQAAEQAVPEAAGLLAEAIRQMSVEDAMQIVNGPDDAATQYFRRVSETQLAERFRPIIERATGQLGVTSAYKGLVSKAAPMLENSMLGGLVPQEALDVDQYVTDKALDGLFTHIALEEKRIRENPAARTTDLLKKVFSSD